MGCRDAILPDPLLKNASVICSTFEKNNWKPYNDKLFLLTALALSLHQKRDQRRNIPITFFSLEKTTRNDRANYRGVLLKDFATVEVIVQTETFLSIKNFVNGSMFGELARRSIRKHSNTVHPLRYISHICYVPSNLMSMYSSKPIVALRLITLSKKLCPWKEIWRSAEKVKKKTNFKTLFVKCEKHCWTN